MNQTDLELSQLLPIELKLRILQAELDCIEPDLARLEQRRKEILQEIQYYEELSFKSRHRTILRRIK